MSRIGLKPIELTSMVSVKVDGRRVEVNGPKSKLEIETPECIDVAVEDGKIKVSRSNDTKVSSASSCLAPSVANGGSSCWQAGKTSIPNIKGRIILIGIGHLISFFAPNRPGTFFQLFSLSGEAHYP